jgi:hypothetical protein
VNCDGEDTFDSVWRKVFDRVHLSQAQQRIGFAPDVADDRFDALALLSPEYQPGHLSRRSIEPDSVLKVLAVLGGQSLPILIIDEFDQLAATPRKAFADLIKMLSDHEVPATVVLVGVAESVEGLLQDHQSVGRALVQVNMPRMSAPEIHKILVGGCARLGIQMDAAAISRVGAISGGLPHYAHLLGMHCAREAIKDQSLHITAAHVSNAVRRAAEDAQQSVQTAYHKAIRSSQRGNLFADVLLACAMAECDELGYFKAQDVRGPMCDITGKAYDIPNFARHLSEFSGEQRGRVLTVVGEARRRSYHFRDPLMQPYVLMQGEVSGRLPASFFGA